MKGKNPGISNPAGSQSSNTRYHKQGGRLFPALSSAKKATGPRARGFFCFDQISPMLATLGAMPPDPEHYAFEFKWDGYRGICCWDGNQLSFRTRNNLNISYECAGLAASKPNLGSSPLVLDGEIVAVNAEGRADFSLLQARFGFRSKKVRSSEAAPLLYVVFDVLYRNNEWTTSRTFKERRALLEGFDFQAMNWKISPCEIGEGIQMLNVAQAHHMEGLIAKRLDSLYEVGRRTGDWIKIKLTHLQEFVIGGWMPGKKGKRNEDGLGSIMLGYYESPGAPYLTYVGNVGTGFDHEERERLKKFLITQAASKSPFGDAELPRGANLSKPLAVVEIEFRGWTADGKVRQGSFKGIRIDKNPREVTKE